MNLNIEEGFQAFSQPTNLGTKWNETESGRAGSAFERLLTHSTNRHPSNPEARRRDDVDEYAIRGFSDSASFLQA